MIQTHHCYQNPPVFMAPHLFVNKSNNGYINMQRHCLFQTLPPLGKNKTAVPDLFGTCDIEETGSSNSHCDEGGREAEENHHVQKIQAERCKKLKDWVGAFFFLSCKFEKLLKQ